MVQVDLITGFLGAGKTTFLRRYVAYLTAQGHHVCILENWFNIFLRSLAFVFISPINSVCFVKYTKLKRESQDNTDYTASAVSMQYRFLFWSGCAIL